MKLLAHILTVIVAGALVLSIVKKNHDHSALNQFGRIPVLHNGRIKPIDSVARNALLLIHGKQSVRHKGVKKSASTWLCETIARPDEADETPVFLIHNPDLKMFLGVADLKKKYFSFNDLRNQLEQIAEETEKIKRIDQNLWSPYQKALSRLNNRLSIYFRLQNSFIPSTHRGRIGGYMEGYSDIVQKGMLVYKEHATKEKFSDEERNILAKLNEYIRKNHFVNHVAYMTVLAPEQLDEEGARWQNFGQGLSEYFEKQKFQPLVALYAQTLEAYNRKKGDIFKEGTEKILDFYRAYSKKLSRKTAFEHIFNQFQPFYKSLMLYILSFVCIVLSWIFWRKGLAQFGYNLFILAFIVHTIGLIARMVLQGRPPVTNLYSSAIFVGWVAIILGMCLEIFYRNQIGVLVSNLIGFVTLIIAHHLSLQGDTLEMMQAVLDSNFWLSTHVVTITMGYSATFLAGTLAIIYIIRAKYTKTVDEAVRDQFFSMIYGIICFALFFSFIGTVLGGIWADQSWGRFWGWDPKENGALLIVLWNATILHVLKNKIFGKETLMLMAVFGNIITSFSWFGVNMLGVGLHSYGFMDSAFFWLIAFICSQLAIISIGFLPNRK